MDDITIDLEIPSSVPAARLRDFLLTTKASIVGLASTIIANLPQPLRPLLGRPAAAEESSNPPPSPPPPRPPPRLDLKNMVLEQPAIVPPVAADWTQAVAMFCFASAINIALQSVQIQNLTRFPLALHFLSLAIVFAFTSIFVAKYISGKFPIQARVLEQIGIFFAVTAFFVAITMPFPFCLQLTLWILFALALLFIFLCNIVHS